MNLVLIVLADGHLAEWTSAVFALCSILLFGTSALYHRGNWTERVMGLFRRADHANIFLLIAGTYTPVAALTLPAKQAIIVLSIIWAGSVAGIAIKAIWPTAPRWVGVSLYILLGWGALMQLPAFWAANPAVMILILAGGLAYTVGAVFYAAKRPNPLPTIFGFHELFHACTIIAFLCHWTAVLLVAL
ncbi:hemolysin III family protein [Glutamicibacter sp. JL.03c]|uniref:PAQR family membrane homeostasis protein TrhA n=1 Tax=Glutamicibacter sp. JL.03c TaxID=2984842 RepID=UPI0021F753B9|nr:hemolysin III family protein [Glutamicibacter sp. JL.03c]UYQ78946.1 hemolysin III family protein [Glutamicibacter sp. JL.03c]